MVWSNTGSRRKRDVLRWLRPRRGGREMEEAAELRALARVERDPRRRVRLLALANVREGMSVAAAARATGMGRATLYRWLAREQAGGPAALGDRPRAGRRR